MAKNNKPADPPDLIAATKTGDRLTTLIALRDLLADKLQNTTSSRDISSMSRRLMQCVSEIETLERVKREIEENPFKLSDFRKKAGLDKKFIDNQHKLNKITVEHERN